VGWMDGDEMGWDGGECCCFCLLMVVCLFFSCSTIYLFIYSFPRFALLCFSTSLFSYFISMSFSPSLFLFLSIGSAMVSMRVVKHPYGQENAHKKPINYDIPETLIPKSATYIFRLFMFTGKNSLIKLNMF
jgi:hypothetical protein